MDFNNYNLFPDSYDSSSERVVITPSSIAQRNFFYVQETGFLKVTKSHKTFREGLDSFLLVLITEGRGTLEYGGCNYSLEKGQCFLISCMEPHGYYSSDDSPWELLWVHFNGVCAKEYYDVFRHEEKTTFYPVDPLQTKNTFREIIRINREHTFLSDVESSKLIVCLLTDAIKAVCFDHMKVASPVAVSARRYINSHYTEKITLEILEKELFVSRFHIEKEFKKHYGLTIFEFIISKRINLAKRMLRYTDKTIEEISSVCGFSDQSYFNRQFKKTEGITGSSYRKKWRG